MENPSVESKRDVVVEIEQRMQYVYIYVYIRGKGVEEEEPWKSIAPLYKRANGFASRRNVYGGGH